MRCVKWTAEIGQAVKRKSCPTLSSQCKEAGRDNQQRRRHGEVFLGKAALAVAKGNATVGELASRLRVHPTQIHT